MIRNEAAELRKTAFVWLRDGFCGALLGVAAILPGVSGGALAFSLGLYQPMMALLAAPREALRRYGTRLLPLGLGWGLGFWGAARGLAAALDLSGAAAAWLLIGLMGGTVPLLHRQAAEQGSGCGARISFLLCALAGLALCFGSGRMLPGLPRLPALLRDGLCGALWGLGVVLPGLSTASLLMALGLYQPVMEGLARLDPAALLGSGAGLCLTVLLMARLMYRLFRRHAPETFHGILGFVTASTLALVPTRYAGWEELLLALLCGGLGFGLTFLLGRMEAAH